MKETKKNIFTVYCESTDMTIIFEEVEVILTGDIISTEGKGFYYGEPDEDATKGFYGRLKAEY